MQKLFSMDGKLIYILNKIADMIILNLLWILCCLPIVTIGASTTALQYVVLKMVRNEESYVVQSFFRAFKENLRQSTIVWMILMLLGMVLYLDFYYAMHTNSVFAKATIFMVSGIAFLILFMANYVFPVMSFFENTTKKVIKNSFLMAIAHLPYTVLIMLINLIPFFLLFAGDFFVGMFLDLIIAVSFTAWVNAHLFRKLFDRYVG